jgi:hypothetical protein
MVEIFSRRDGPRPQDVRVKALIDKNRLTIERIADHLTQGGYSAGKVVKAAAPRVEAKTIVHALGGSNSSRTIESRPTVRATLNGRVVVVDDNSGRQLHHLGEIRRRDGQIVFSLASAENGFSAPLPDDILNTLADLDQALLALDGGEEALVGEIASRLDFE